jgi:hypothetical protein
MVDRCRPLEESVSNGNKREIHCRVTARSRSNSNDKKNVDSLNSSRDHHQTYKSPIKTYKMISLELYGSKQKANMTDRVWQHQQNN